MIGKPSNFCLPALISALISCSTNTASKNYSLESNLKSQQCSEENTVLVASHSIVRGSERCHFSIKPHMIRLAQVKTRSVFLRNGPSSKFEIKDNPTLKSEYLVVLYKMNQWIKVLDVANGEIGWLHKKLITELKAIPSDFKLAVRKLPMVFVTQPIRQAENHNGTSNVSVQFGKGKKFRTLINGSRKVLVYLSKDKQPIWIKRGLVE